MYILYLHTTVFNLKILFPIAFWLKHFVRLYFLPNTSGGRRYGLDPPKCALHCGHEATVQEKPGNQEKWLSAGHRLSTSALRKVTTSNWRPCGFSNVWTCIRRPPGSVWLRPDNATRLCTVAMVSELKANSCPHSRHRKSVSALVVFPASVAAAAHAAAGRHTAATSRNTHEIISILWRRPQCDRVIGAWIQPVARHLPRAVSTFCF